MSKANLEWDVMMKVRNNGLWVGPGENKADKDKSVKVVRINDRPCTRHEAMEVVGTMKPLTVKDEKDKKVYVNATLYPAGILEVWMEERQTAKAGV